MEASDEEDGDNELAERVRAFLSTACEKPTDFQCKHTPPDSFRPGELVRIETTADDIYSIRLHYRHVNQAEEYNVVNMLRQNSHYVATIPGDYTDSPYPLQYFMVFRDKGGRAWICPGLNATLSDQPYYVVRQESA